MPLQMSAEGSGTFRVSDFFGATEGGKHKTFLRACNARFPPVDKNGDLAVIHQVTVFARAAIRGKDQVTASVGRRDGNETRVRLAAALRCQDGEWRILEGARNECLDIDLIIHFPVLEILFVFPSSPVRQGKLQ
jgi:hypothetical protein